MVGNKSECKIYVNFGEIKNVSSKTIDKGQKKLYNMTNYIIGLY